MASASRRRIIRLCTFVSTNFSSPRSGLLLSSGKVLDLTSALGIQGPGTSPLSIQNIIESYETREDKIFEIAESAEDSTASYPENLLLNQKFYRLLSPIPRPNRNVFCVGKNYSDHIEEIKRANEKKEAENSHGNSQASAQSVDSNKFAQFFTKSPDCVIGPNDHIQSHSNITKWLDYEAELGVVIGKAGKDISTSDAPKHIFGYTIGNDVTARDLQKRHGQWFKGKSLDATCPLGPCIVPASCLDPSDLSVCLLINGEVRQESRTSKMIFKIPEIIMQLSEGFTLLPGDVILTGTPSGVGFGMVPPQMLKSGDKIDIDIECIGRLSNIVL